MPEATTIYEVVTRYVTDTRSATSELNNLTRGVTAAGAATRNTEAAIVRMGSSFGLLTRYIGPAAAALAAYGALRTTFDNLNQAMNRQITLAAQLNLNFEYAKKPVDQWAASMRVGRDIMLQLTREVQRLPGQPGEYFGIAQYLSGAVFKAGGRPTDLVRMTEQAGVIARMSGQPMERAGIEFMEMMQGRARQMNPMFAFLKAYIPEAERFNRLRPEERLKALATAMTAMAGNADLLKSIMGTWDTQFSTLKQNLFGVDGILGRLGAGPFQKLIDGLTTFNDTLMNHKDQIVIGLRDVGAALKALAESVPGPDSNIMGWLEKQSAKVGETTRNAVYDYGGAALRTVPALVTDAFNFQRSIFAFGLPGAKMPPPQTLDAWSRNLFDMRAARGMFREGEGEHEPPASWRDPNAGRRRNENAQTNITNYVDIHVDVKGDISPEAMAVKVKEAWNKELMHPTMSRRGALPLPLPGQP